MSENIIAKNLRVIAYKDLPDQMSKLLTLEQQNCLLFGVKKFKVVTEPKVQTFQLGSNTQGAGVLYGGGVGTSLGSNWNVFGNMGIIGLNQLSINTFKTDIHLRLEDLETKEQFFLEKSVSLPITVSIATGDEIMLYFTRGGFAKPLITSDFRLDDWAPFFIQDMPTNQIVPLSPLPSMMRPIKRLTGINKFLMFVGILEFAFGIIYINNALAAVIGFTFGIIFFIQPIRVYLYNQKWKKRGWKEYQAAKTFASHFQIDTSGDHKNNESPPYENDRKVINKK